MSSKKVYEDKDKIIYEEQKDPWGFVGEVLNDLTGSKTPTNYKAVDKHDGSTANGKTVGEARHNLESGKDEK